MKNLIFIFLLSFSVNNLSAQYIGGLYSGTLINDSTKKVQTYELALNEYRDKIWGYSYTTFVVNDTFYYGIKKVTGKKKDGQLIIEDEKMIANNYPESPAKKVRQTNVIQLKNEDTLRSVDGTWSTNETKIYYALNGGMDMKRADDSSRSALISHLKELDIIPQPKYAATEVKVKQKEDKVKVKVEEKVVKKEAEKPLPLPYHQRKEKMLQTVEVISDSLVLSFYDNGVIDGDSISVYLNNENIIASTKLTATATKKTIAVNRTGEIRLLLVAENMGTIPPNTGLLVIRDGEKTYQVNFSADMQTNAAIILRKANR
jgi:hypothetical protein